jgi:hypothetical protein
MGTPHLFKRFNIMRLFDSGTVENQSPPTVSALQLKQLLIHITDTSICFRFRLLGGMWMKNLMKVSTVRENSVMLYDEKDSKYHLVGLNDIMQFEIDERYQGYQPHFHYEVKSSSELV